MTKKALLDLLTAFKDDDLVVVNAGCNELANGRTVVAVELVSQRAFKGDSNPVWHVDHFPEEKDTDYICRTVINIRA